MCGITGLVATGIMPLAPWLQRMTDAIAHRGPDDHGYLGWRDTGTLRPTRDAATLGAVRVGLGHRRLAIIDLTPTGWQPMVTADGRYAIVFNGEIYNYLELRRELEQAGAVFHTQSDTEVLLTGFVRWGVAMLPRLVGMFAFAILDTATHRLTLARDFFGIKPLYYTEWQHGFAFASEIKALLTLPGVRRQVDPAQLYAFLRHSVTDHDAHTVYVGVTQLPAAHWLCVDLDHTQTQTPVRYWQPAAPPRPGPATMSIDEAARELRRLFIDNVRLHLRSDVPVGSALSGGIDSASIAGAMRELEPHHEIHSFSFVTDDPLIGEGRWVDLVTERCRLHRHITTATPQEMQADLDRLIVSQDEPTISTSLYVQYRVFQLAAASGIKVMLDGQGADELLAGYRGYVVPRLFDLWFGGALRDGLALLRRALRQPGADRLGLCLRPIEKGFPRVGALARQALGLGAAWPRWLRAPWFAQRGVASPATTPEPVDGTAFHRELRTMLTRTNLPMLLRFEDRNSMAWSIESRVPFLTPTFADFALSLPAEYILDRTATTKSVFRRAMRGMVPDAVLDRRDKIGFAAPESAWMKGAASWVEALLAQADPKRCAFLDLAAVRDDWAAFATGRNPYAPHLWRVLNTIRWMQLFDLDSA